MKEISKHQLDIVQNHSYPKWISGFSLRDILASAIMDPRFNEVVEDLDKIYVGSFPDRRSLQSDIITCATALNITQDDSKFLFNRPSFSECVSLHAVQRRLIIEPEQISIMCSKQLTVVFAPKNMCSIFIIKHNEVDLLMTVNVNKLDIMLQLFCCVRGIDLLPFPKILSGFKDPPINFNRVFRRIMKCIQPNNSVYDEQIVHLRLESEFYNLMWEGYGIKALSMLMTTLTSYLHDGILYNETLLAAISRRNLILETRISVISVTRAFVSRGIAVSRYQFHLLLTSHTDSIANHGFPTSSTVIDLKANTDLGTLSTLAQELPTELKDLIVESRINVHDTTCSCNTIHCNHDSHTYVCKSRQKILDDKVDILYPISSRIVHSSSNRLVRQTYVVYTTTLDGHIWFGEKNILGKGFLIGNQARSDFRILNRLHFQGNTFDLNSHKLKHIMITDDDHHPVFPQINRMHQFLDNVHFQPKHPFNDARVQCSHEQEFVPRMESNQKHYLFFD